MDQYFQQMEKIVKQRKTSSRVRFMLQDVIELRHVSGHSEIRSIMLYCSDKCCQFSWLISYLCLPGFRRNFSGCQEEKIIIQRQLTKSTRKLLKRRYKKISLCNSFKYNSNCTREVKAVVEVRHLLCSVLSSLVTF